MTCLPESCFAERKGTLFTSSAKKLVIIKPMFNGCRSQQQPRPFWVAEQWHKQTLAYLSYLLFDSALLFKGHLSTTEWTRIWKTTLHNLLLCCAEDPSYTNITLSQTPNLCSTSQILLVHLVKHVSGPPLGRAGCCHVSSFLSLHG